MVMRFPCRTHPASALCSRTKIIVCGKVLDFPVLAIAHGKQFVRRRSAAGVLVVVVDGEDFVERVFVWIDVDHPAEDDRLEAAIRSIAGILRGDRTFQSKLLPIRVAELSFLRHAQVWMQMPQAPPPTAARAQLRSRPSLLHGF